MLTGKIEVWEEKFVYVQTTPVNTQSITEMWKEFDALLTEAKAQGFVIGAKVRRKGAYTLHAPIGTITEYNTSFNVAFNSAGKPVPLKIQHQGWIANDDHRQYELV